MIDLEHAQAAMRIAIREGVESRAEDNVLTDTTRDRTREFVLGVTAARCHESAESAGEGVVLFGIGTEIVCGFGTDDPQGERVVENFWIVQQLVRGAANRHAMCGLAEFTFLHSQLRPDFTGPDFIRPDSTKLSAASNESRELNAALPQ